MTDVEGAPAETLVIGYGNRTRGDDAAGPIAIECLRRLACNGVMLEEWDGDSLQLIERWSLRESVVVIDAIQSGRRAGEVTILSARELETETVIHSVSTHGFGLVEAVRLGRVLERLPPRLWVVGIEGERFDMGTSPTEAVRRGALNAARLVAARWGHGPCTS